MIFSEKLEGGDVFFVRASAVVHFPILMAVKVGGTTLGSFVNNNATADNPTYGTFSALYLCPASELSL